MSIAVNKVSSEWCSQLWGMRSLLMYKSSVVTPPIVRNLGDFADICYLTFRCVKFNWVWIKFPFHAN